MPAFSPYFRSLCVMATVCSCAHKPTTSDGPATATSDTQSASADSPAPDQRYRLSGTIQVNGQGNIMLQLCTASSFDDPTAAPDAFNQVLPVDDSTDEVGFAFEDITAGSYGLRAYLDENKNGRLDMSLMGPTEPWGVYRSSRPAFRGPSWEEVRFSVQSDRDDLTIALE